MGLLATDGVETVTTESGLTDWITVAVAAAAFLVSLIALYYSKKAADASKLSAEAADRSAGAAERAEWREVQEAQERAVRWQLVGTGRYQPNRLTNLGDSTAQDVRVEMEEGMKVHGASYTQAEVGPNSSMLIPVSITMGLRDRTITVRWKSDGQERSWSHPAFSE